MKNIDYIRNLPIETLAEMLFRIEYCNNGYYDIDDIYIGLDGDYYYYKSDCIKANIEWLNKEYKGE